MKHFSHHDIPQLSDPEGSGNIDRAALLIQRKTKICNLSSSKNSDGVIKDQSRPCLSRLTWKIILTGINYLHECIVNPGSWERSLRMSCRVIINLYRIYRSVHLYLYRIYRSVHPKRRQYCSGMRRSNGSANTNRSGGQVPISGAVHKSTLALSHTSAEFESS